MRSNGRRFRSRIGTDRRTFLKTSILGGLTTVGISGSLTGTVAADGAFSKFAELAREGEFKKAKRVAKQNDIEYHQNTTQLGNKESTEGISTQDYLEKPGPGEITLMTGSDGKEEWVTLYWDLYPEENPGVDTPEPKDACVISWEDSQWGLTSLDDVYTSSEATRETSSGVITDNPPVEMKGGGLIGEEDNALGFTVQDWLDMEDGEGTAFPDHITGSAQIKLRRQNYPKRQPGRVETLYEHIWSPGGIAQYNFLENVSISPTGTVSVSTPTLADSWEARDDYSG